MATKTAVCPECGEAAARGRYACSECGALLASVAVTPREWPAAEGQGADLAGGPDAVADGPGVTANPAGSAEAAIGDPAPVAAVADAGAAAGASSEASPQDESDVADPLAFDEDLPLGSTGEVRRAPEPTFLHDLPDEPVEAFAPVVAFAPAAAFAPGVASAPAGAVAVPPEPTPSWPTMPSPAPPAVPTWPPPGDRGAVARPAPRMPAGAYLPPSAVLLPLDGTSGLGATAVPDATRDPGAAAAAWARHATDALTDALRSVRLTADGGRGIVAAGSGLAALGFLLPWINGLPNGNPFDGYLDRWGFAGPGMWLVWIGLVALAVVAGSAGRPASWPVALPAIATAAFLFGLLWPYLVGGFGRSVGVIVVLVGTIVLAVGGVLEREGRHAGSGPDVREVDAGGR